MKPLAPAFLLLAALAAPALAQQDGEWVEVRFHRVHLLNGNFIDGQLLKDNAQGAILQLKVGEMTIRRDMIDRIEFVQMRSRYEKPRIIAPPKGTTTPPPRKTETRPDPVPDATPVVMIAGDTDKETRAQADDLLARLRKAGPEQKGPIAAEIGTLGVKGALYLAANLEVLDDSALTYVGPALGRYQSPKVQEILAKLTLSSRAGVRAQAAAGLGLSQDPAMSKFLQPLLQDSDGIIRGIAVEALGRIKAVDAIPAVTRACLDPDRAMRSKALIALDALLAAGGRSEDRKTILFDLVRDAKGPGRSEILGTLARDSKKEDWALFSPYLDDSDAGVRQAAAHALGQLAAPDSAAAVTSRLGTERDKWARMYLAQAAQKLRAYRGIDDLIQWLTEDDPDVKAAAHQALRGLTGQVLEPRRDLWQAYWTSARSQYIK